jgi:hypothetical protein
MFQRIARPGLIPSRKKHCFLQEKDPESNNIFAKSVPLPPLKNRLSINSAALNVTVAKIGGRCLPDCIPRGRDETSA